MKDYNIRVPVQTGVVSNQVSAAALEAWMAETDARLDGLEEVAANLTAAVAAIRKSVGDLTGVSQDIVNAVLKVNSTCSDFAHALSDIREDIDGLKGGSDNVET